MKCPNCGAELNEGSRFCPNCGGNIADTTPANLGGAVSSQQPQAGVQQVAAGKKGLAVASLVLGILALIGAFTSSWTVVLGVPCLIVGIAGLILGIVGITKKQGAMAIAGVVLCVISILVGVFAMSVTGAVIDSAGTNGDAAVSESSPDEGDSSGSKESVDVSEADNPDNIKIKSAEFGTNSLGDKLVYITYSWENNKSGNATPFYTTYSAKAYQDGVELDSGVDTSYKGDLYGDQNDVKKGKTQTFTKCYQLADKKHDIEVEVTDWISWGDETVYASKTFKLK